MYSSSRSYFQKVAPGNAQVKSFPRYPASVVAFWTLASFRPSTIVPLVNMDVAFLNDNISYGRSIIYEEDTTAVDETPLVGSAAVCALLALRPVFYAGGSRCRFSPSTPTPTELEPFVNVDGRETQYMTMIPILVAALQHLAREQHHHHHHHHGDVSGDICARCQCPR